MPGGADVTISRAAIGSADYHAACELRERVLLRNVGLDHAGFVRTYPGAESAAEHFIAQDAAGRVVGCALLVPGYPEPGVAKLMQMAVESPCRGAGVGRRILSAFEARAFDELGCHAVMCHAQMPAIGFYERCGWQCKGPIFQEAGIDHRAMWKHRPA